MKTTQEVSLKQDQIPAPPDVSNDQVARWRQYIERYWMCYLDGSEWKIVCMILDRSLGWQHLNERVTRRHFASGVVDRKTGKVHHRGTGLSDSTIDSALRELEERQVISVKRIKRAGATECYYSLNYSWKPTSKKSKNSPRKMGRSTPDFGVGHPKSWGVRDKNEERNNKRKNDSRSPSAPATIAEAQAKGSPKRLSALDALKKTHPSANDVETIWRAGHTELFPAVPFIPWEVKELAMIKSVTVRWTRSGEKATMGEFVDWCVRNWVPLVREKFSWMTDPPAPRVPSPSLFVAFSDKFIQAWQERMDIERRASMSPKERYIQDLVRRGTPHELAVEQVEERFRAGEAIVRLKAEQAKLHKKRIALARQAQYEFDA